MSRRSLRAFLGSLALLLLSTGALAQGVIDQQNDPSSTSGFGCGVDVILKGTILQSFVPAADNLIAVTLRLQAGSAFPAAGYTTTLRLREGTATGTVLREATAFVAGPMAPSAQALVRFDMEPLAVTPGATYLIEWVTPPTTALNWVGMSGDPYPAGTAYSCSGNAWPGGLTDLNFITWAAEQELTCAELLARLRASVDALDLRWCADARMSRLLSWAAKELDRGKPHAASSLVLAFECQVRLLAHMGVLSRADARDLIERAEAIRQCLGKGR